MSHRDETDALPPDPPQAGADAARVEGYLHGDGTVFRELDGWIRSEILARYPGLSSEHEDVCQAVHEKLLANLRGGRFKARSALRTYITAIAHHSAIDWLREIRRQRDAFVALAREPRLDWELPRGLQQPDETSLLHRVVLTLPRQCRELWKMVFVDKLRYDQIARRLTVPEGTVKSRMWHCRKKARVALARARRPIAAP